MSGPAAAESLVALSPAGGGSAHTTVLGATLEVCTRHLPRRTPPAGSRITACGDPAQCCPENLLSMPGPRPPASRNGVWGTSQAPQHFGLILIANKFLNAVSCFLSYPVNIPCLLNKSFLNT